MTRTRTVARLAVPLLGLVLLTGCGKGPVIGTHSADGAEVLAHTEEGASGQSGEVEGSAPSGHSAGGDSAAGEDHGGTASGGTDEAFLRALREHHEAALRMAEEQIRDGADPEATALARRVVEQQTAAIEEIDRLLAG